MSSQAQLDANHANALRSSGPNTDQGKATSCLNNFRHGLAGAFTVLAWEDQEEFDALHLAFSAEHRPQTVTERLLIQNMAQHYWLSRRALVMQELTFNLDVPMCDDPKHLALYLRYQTTHDRAFHKCLTQLLRLTTEKRKAEIGFESQKRAEAQELRKEAAEMRKETADIRKQEMHEARLRAINSQTLEREIDNEVRQTIEAPLPGHIRVPFDTMKDPFKLAVDEVSRHLKATATAA